MSNEETLNGKEMKTGFEKTSANNSNGVPKEIPNNSNVDDLKETEKDNLEKKTVTGDSKIDDNGNGECKVKDKNLTKEESGTKDGGGEHDEVSRPNMPRKGGNSSVIGSLISLLGSKRSLSMDSNTSDDRADNGHDDGNHNRSSRASSHSSQKENDNIDEWEISESNDRRLNHSKSSVSTEERNSPENLSRFRPRNLSDTPSSDQQDHQIIGHHSHTSTVSDLGLEEGTPAFLALQASSRLPVATHRSKSYKTIDTARRPTIKKVLKKVKRRTTDSSLSRTLSNNENDEIIGKGSNSNFNLGVSKLSLSSTNKQETQDGNAHEFHPPQTRNKRRKRSRKEEKYQPNNYKGNVINGLHEQYTLTFGMKLGIRNAIGRPPDRGDLRVTDFMQVDKYDFLPNGCNKAPFQTPPHPLGHEFKFKDYSPKVFNRIRELFGIDSAAYMLSVCGNTDYIEFLSNSKSRMFFFYTHDGKYMIKTQTAEENKFLRQILPHYYRYIAVNPNTLLTRFYGMHRVKMRHLRHKVHFIVMNSVFDTTEKLHAKYDLKGSTVGRAAGEETRKKDDVVLKDLDFIQDRRILNLGPRKKMFLAQLKRDSEFLASLRIIDYSLLIGIHNRKIVEPQNENESGIKIKQRINQNNLMTNGSTNLTLDEESSDASNLNPGKNIGVKNGIGQDKTEHNIPYNRTHSFIRHTGSSLENSNLQSKDISKREGRRHSSLDYSVNSVYTSTTSAATYETTDQSYDDSFDSDDSLSSTESEGSEEEENVPSALDILGGESSFVSNEGVGVKQWNNVPVGNYKFLTHRPDNGISSRDEDGEKLDEIYYVGIIDILQQFTIKKGLENFFKGFKYRRTEISATSPYFYSSRFVRFISKFTK